MNQPPKNEATPFHPRRPYAVAKASAHWMVANYREACGLFACNGILFNHESPLLPARFVTRKIVDSAVRIANGSDEKLALGRLNIVRDWVDLDWREYVDSDQRLFRPSDIAWSQGDARLANACLGWEAHTKMPELVKLLVEVARNQ